MDELIVTQPRKKHKHILEKDRYLIEAMLRGGNSDEAIIRTLGCSERTYRRELARGRCEQIDSQLRTYTIYHADYAQRKHDAAAENKGRYAKLNNNPELRKFVEAAVKRANYSPYAALEAAKRGLEVRNHNRKIIIEASAPLRVDVSVKTVYNSIDRGEIEITRKDLLRKEGWKQEKSKPRQGLHTRGKSIDDRSPEATFREEPGHWEGDLVVSKKGGSGAILTLTDRLRLVEIIIKLLSKEQSSVIAAFKTLKAKRGAALDFKSIAFDNGSEFLDFEAIMKAANCPEVYYAHPYSSWERGTNENHNGIIRRFFPKGTDFAKVSQRRLTAVQDWMNNYPRKALSGHSPRSFAALFA